MVINTNFGDVKGQRSEPCASGWPSYLMSWSAKLFSRIGNFLKLTRMTALVEVDPDVPLACLEGTLSMLVFLNSYGARSIFLNHRPSNLPAIPMSA